MKIVKVDLNVSNFQYQLNNKVVETNSWMILEHFSAILLNISSTGGGRKLVGKLHCF